VQDAFKILMKNREQTTSELQAKTREIIQNFSNNNNHTTLEEEMHEFVLFPKERAIIRRKKMIDDAQKSIDFITSWENFTQSDVSYTTNLRNALKKSIEVRIIVGKTEDENLLVSETKSLREKYSTFRLHWIPSSPDARLMLVDNHKVLFAKSPATSFDDTPFLWSINQSLVSVVKNYFEIMWLSSFEPKNKENNLNNFQ
jgi:phosphatidylserine/phosphatidylglycerophosphate/cardiolipin synthase-like enzyme